MLENPVVEPENQDTAATPLAQAPLLSRRALLTLGLVAGAALTLPVLPTRADFPYSDLRTLRYLEEVARLQAGFFSAASLSTPAEALQEREANLINLIAQQDGELVRWFASAQNNYSMGAASTFYTPNMSTSRPMPSYQFGLGTLSTRDALLSRAIEMKETSVGAFHGAVGGANSPKMIQAFAALAGVQGRHLAMLREVAGQEALVDFEAALSRREAAEQFAPYGFNPEVLT